MPDDGQAEAEPAVRARRAAVPLAEALEDVRQERRVDAAAVVADADLRPAPPMRRRRRRPARPRGVNLTALRQQVPDHLLQAVAVADHRTGDRAHRPVRAGDRASRRRPAARLDGGAHDRPQVERLHLEPQLAGDDARHVEQVVDQPRLGLGVALDASPGRARCAPRRRMPRFEQLGPAEDRVERRAQLVRERGQEVVLGAVRVLRVAIEERVVERERRPRGHIGPQPQPRRLEPARRPRIRSSSIPASGRAPPAAAS